VTNPYSQKVHIIPARPGQAAGIVFWSKNYADFLAGDYGPRLLDMGLGLFFHFTVNSRDLLLEPNVPPLSERLRQFGKLSFIAGNRGVVWRFDPICHYSIKNGPVVNNLGDFDSIADAAAEAGVSRCVISFMDFYPKIKKRLLRHPGLVLIEPECSLKKEILGDLETRLAARGMGLFTCCEKETAEASGKASGACVDHALLESLWGKRLSRAPDKGQRRALGCLCQASRDVGNYGINVCGHDCLYCYANPGSGKNHLTGGTIEE
jgi:hypothetical protein